MPAADSDTRLLSLPGRYLHAVQAGDLAAEKGSLIIICTDVPLMEEGRDASQAILSLLKYNQRGMTVSDVARKIGWNRNSTARQLEILVAEGRAEVRVVGTAKVYSLTQRVPLSAFLCFTKNMILILDAQMTIVQANEQYLKFIGREKRDLLGKNLWDAALPVVTTPEAREFIQSIRTEQVITDIRYQHGKDDFFYQMEVIPTTFEGGEKGLTIVLEDITERKKYVKNMEFLARTAQELVDLPPEADIYLYVAEKVAELLPNPPQCFVESFDEVNRQFFLRAMLSREFRERGSRIVGQDVVGMAFPIQEFFFFHLHETVSSLRPLREYHFRPYFDDEEYSMFEVCIRQIPEEICNELIDKLRIGRMYQIGLVWQDQLFGIVGIFMSPENELADKQVFESFVRQASIAIARRQTEERLRRSEHRFKDLMNFSAVPAVLIEGDGRYAFVNEKFSEMFGYTLQDIPNGKAWFNRAFPDPDRRKNAVAAWKSDLAGAGIGPIPPRTFEVRCKSGEDKTVLCRPVILSEGAYYVSYEDLSGSR